MIFHCLCLYCPAKNVILKQNKVEKGHFQKIEYVRDYLLTFKILSQESDTLYATVENKVVVVPNPTTTEFLKARRTDKYCQNMFKLVAIDARLTVGAYKLTFHKAFVDGSEEVIVPEIFRRANDNGRQFPVMAGYLRTRKMYDELRRQPYWPHMNADVNALVVSRQSSRRHSSDQEY